MAKKLLPDFTVQAGLPNFVIQACLLTAGRQAGKSLPPLPPACRRGRDRQVKARNLLPDGDIKKRPY